MKQEIDNDLHNWLAKIEEESQKEIKRQINTLNWISVTCFISASIMLIILVINIVFK